VISAALDSSRSAEPFYEPSVLTPARSTNRCGFERSASGAGRTLRYAAGAAPAHRPPPMTVTFLNGRKSDISKWWTHNGNVSYYRSPPNHCHECGTAFPWTAEQLAAAKEHAAELDGLDEAERLQLQGAIDDLAAGGPRTELAVSRFKNLMGKASEAVGSGLYKIVLDVASEAAKKEIMG
jgi:hypothetical protein